MLLFYAPDILTCPQLPETEAQHCIKVFRKVKGDSINITDGNGYFYQAIIKDAHPKHCQVELIRSEKAFPGWSNRITIALAPTKNIDRTEWFVEKSTEIGIDRIGFFRTQNSERKDLKMDRIHKITVSAMKQSVKATHPKLQPLTDYHSYITQTFEGQKFIAHCRPGDKKLLSKAYHKNENVWILIGPEGDFSEEEIQLAISNGFEPVSLGDSRLRTETAALTACQTIHILNQIL